MKAVLLIVGLWVSGSSLVFGAEIEGQLPCGRMATRADVQDDLDDLVETDDENTDTDNDNTIIR